MTHLALVALGRKKSKGQKLLHLKCSANYNLVSNVSPISCAYVWTPSIKVAHDYVCVRGQPFQKLVSLFKPWSERETRSRFSVRHAGKEWSLFNQSEYPI